VPLNLFGRADEVIEYMRYLGLQLADAAIIVDALVAALPPPREPSPPCCAGTSGASSPR